MGGGDFQQKVDYERQRTAIGQIAEGICSVKETKSSGKAQDFLPRITARLCLPSSLLCK